MTILTGAALSMTQVSAVTQTPARLAIYYGYPSLVNGARGDVEKAAATFSLYDVVVFGDGLEFNDHQPSRVAQGDPAEHQKLVQILAGMKRRNGLIRIYGYVPLGEYQHLSDSEIQQRIGLWKQMGVAGIFLDEGSYDFGNVDRARQNKVVNFVHQQGLSAFMNGFFPDHIFGVENEPLYAKGKNKNPSHEPAALNAKDLYLLESFQIREGVYDDPANWQQRMKKVLAYRNQYGTQMFAITTAGNKPFDAQKLNYGWWSAWMNDLEGFGWGEPNFSASDNLLPDHRCVMNAADLKKTGPVGSDKARVWRKAGGEMVVLDTGDHTVKRVKPAGLSPASQGLSLVCGAK